MDQRALRIEVGASRAIIATALSYSMLSGAWPTRAATLTRAGALRMPSGSPPPPPPPGRPVPPPQPAARADGLRGACDCAHAVGVPVVDGEEARMRRSVLVDRRQGNELQLLAERLEGGRGVGFLGRKSLRGKADLLDLG